MRVNDTLRSAVRVLDLLEYLSGRGRGGTLSEIAAALGLPETSTLALLRALVARGYAARDTDDRYALNATFRPHGFGRGGHRHARLVAPAQPLVERLCETVPLGVARVDGVQILSKVVPRQDLRRDAGVTQPCPLCCATMGRILTAFAPEERREAMLQASPHLPVTARTVADLAALCAIIAEVGTAGLAIVEEEWALGGTGLAVPVFHADGSIGATLDVGCVTTRFHAKRGRVIAALRAAGHALAAALSTHPLSSMPT